MPASPEQQWTPQEDNAIRALVKQGMQMKDMPPHVPNRTLRAIQSRIYGLGLKSGQPRTKYSKNEAFWETPNLLNSYYAGLAAADMSLSDENRSTLAWECHDNDEQYMRRFMYETGFTGDLFYSIDKSPRSDNVSRHCNLRVGACQKWNADMARVFNVTPNKAHRLAPPLFQNDLLACCYLLGYTDGDGCVHVNKKGTATLSYTSASHDIIQWIRSFVESCFPYFVRRKRKRPSTSSSQEGTYHRCTVYGLQAVKLFELLRTIDVPRFARKWDNPAFLRLCETYHTKWPDQFAPHNTPIFNDLYMIVQPTA